MSAAFSLRTVDLVTNGDKGAAWHIVSLPTRDATLCGFTPNEAAQHEDRLDAHVIAHRGRRVCAACRRRLK